MPELFQFCRRDSNDADTRQARIFQSYIIASLLGISQKDELRFFNEIGQCYRVAMFQ